MKRNFVLLMLGFVLIANQSLFSENWVQLVRKDIQVGTTPVGVFYDKMTADFNVFCAGADKNFNGKFEPDSGDVLPSWWKLEVDIPSMKIKSEKILDFPFGTIQMTNFRPAFSSEIRKIWISTFSGINVYSLDTYSEITAESIPLNSTGLSYYGGRLYISKSMSNNKLDTVLVYNVSTKVIEEKYPAGINLLQCIPYKPFEFEKEGLAFLNLGPYSSDESNVQYDSFGKAEAMSFKQINIGNTGNHLTSFQNSSLKRELLLSTSMFSGRVDIIDPYKDFHKQIPTISKEWYGPSFSKVFEITSDSGEIVPVLATTNYNGTIEFRKMRINEVLGEVSIETIQTDSITTGYKSEGFDFAEKNGKFYLISANTLGPDYSAGNTVSFITLVRPNSISENNSEENNSVTITNSGILHIENTISQIKRICLYDMNGSLLVNQTAQPYVNLSKIQSGVYILHIETENGNVISKRILKHN